MLKLLVSLKRNQLELEIVEKEGNGVNFPQHIQQITAIFSSAGHIWDSLDGRTFYVESKQSRLLEVPFDYGSWAEKHYDLPTVMSIQSLALFAGIRIHDC